MKCLMGGCVGFLPSGQGLKVTQSLFPARWQGLESLEPLCQAGGAAPRCQAVLSRHTRRGIRSPGRAPGGQRRPRSHGPGAAAAFCHPCSAGTRPAPRPGNGGGGGGHGHRGGTEPCDRPWLFRGLSSRPGGQRESETTTERHLFISLLC